MNEKRSAGWYLCSIMACSGLSAFGNLAMSLEDFQPDSLNHAGSLIQRVSPWLGVAFPLLIILISIAADKVLDVNPTEHLDVEAYRKLEQKRIAILVERNNFLEQQVEQDRRRDDIKQRAKDNKRRKRETPPEEPSPASTELEHMMSQLQAVQEQVRQLSVAAPARVSEQQELCISPPLPETTPRHPRAGEGIQPPQEQHPLTVVTPNQPEVMDSFEVRFALSYLDQRPALKQQALDLYDQDPQTAPSQIAALVKQQYGLRGVTPGLVSQVFTRLIPSAHHGYLDSSSVDNKVNTGEDAFADSTRSVEEPANGHHAETIPITTWRAEVVESEQETDQPPNSRVNSKTCTNQTAEEPRRGVAVDAHPSVNGHLTGQESDHLVNHSTNTGADSEESTARTVSEPSIEQHSEHTGEQEEDTEETPEGNGTASTPVNIAPETSVNTRANRAAKTPRRSNTARGFTEKQRGEASQRVRRVLKKHPTASLSQLAEKAKVSRGYASQVRAQVLEEQQRQTSSDV